MADAIRALPRRQRPSEAGFNIDLTGLDRIGAIVNDIRLWKGKARQAEASR